MVTQMAKFFETKFSRYQCGFRKDFSIQQCLLAMLEKWKRLLEKGKKFTFTNRYQRHLTVSTLSFLSQN